MINLGSSLLEMSITASIIYHPTFTTRLIQWHYLFRIYPFYSPSILFFLSSASFAASILPSTFATDPMASR